jgi:hypothetical protein
LAKTPAKIPSRDFVAETLLCVQFDVDPELLRAVQNGGAGRPNLVALGW